MQNINDVEVLRGKKLIFAILAHKDEHVLSEQVQNIRHFNPDAGVLLYNGGTDMNFGKSLDIPICPYSHPLGWGKQTRFLWDVMKWLEETKVEYEYLISMDHDILFVKHGFDLFLEETMAGYDCMGWEMKFSYVKQHRKHRVVQSMEQEWHLWKPFFGTEYFIHYFNPTQVYRHGIIQRMLSSVDMAVAEQMMNDTKVFALEEVFPATLAMACGGKCRQYPRDKTGDSFVRWGDNISIDGASHAKNHPLYYWIHPVKGDTLIQVNQWLLTGKLISKKRKATNRKAAEKRHSPEQETKTDELKKIIKKYIKKKKRIVPYSQKIRRLIRKKKNFKKNKKVVLIVRNIPWEIRKKYSKKKSKVVLFLKKIDPNKSKSKSKSSATRRRKKSA